MNAFQRVINTLQGAPADRTPVFAVLGAYGARLTGVDLRTLYSDPAAYVAGQRAVQETFGFDLVLAPFDYSAIAEAFGGEAAWFADQAPNMKRPAADSIDSAIKLPLPDPRHTGRLPVSLEVARQLADIYREKVPLFAAVPGPCSLPVLVMGLEPWIELLLFDEANASRLLEKLGEFFVAWSNALLESGVLALIVTEAMATAEVMPRNLFVERLLPHLKDACKRVQGPMVMSNSGGRIGHALDVLAVLPGVIGIAVSSKDSLIDSRRLLGADSLMLGGPDNLAMPTALPEEVRCRCLACLETAAPARHFILAHSGADVPLSTPPENLRAMIEASEQFAAKEGSRL